jgi:asparagine synthase (glutamine-hydrolysing)
VCPSVSGFIGIVHPDGCPIDSELLQNLTAFLSFRGPDAQRTMFHGSMGFGHALLQIENGTPQEKQPAQLDGRLWITSDARIDSRAELIEKLKAKSPDCISLSRSSSDAELILHAYDAWGETCVEHLLGDFSFAIWDEPIRRLFCARDQFGVKPFFYAQAGPLVIFSNTLDCVRRHPSVSSDLDHLSIADFLLFDRIQDPSGTSFKSIRRLPPAHFLKVDHGRLTVRRYWELSGVTPIQFASDKEYIEQFRRLLDTSVADRLRSRSAGVTMSGGLDSTIVAASALRIFGRNEDPSELRAYTEVYDSLIPHEERYYATLTADALGIPIEFLISDHWKIFERADQPEFQTPEPMHSPLPNTTIDQLQQASVRSHVVLTGYGGDPVLCSRISVHFRQLIGAKQFGQAVRDATRYLSVDGRLSRLYIRKRLNLLFPSKSQLPVYPRWLNADFERDFGLRDRWNTLNRQSIPESAIRPEAQGAMADLFWANLFEMHDAGVTRLPTEVCHPFFDIRLVKFLLGLPRLPWCCDKQILREAGRGDLPESVRLRRKSPLAADPLIVTLQRRDSAWVDRFEKVPELERFVVRNRIPNVYEEKMPWEAWINLRPLSLNFWLRGQSQ